MIKNILLLILPFILSCSLDTKSGIWTQDKKISKVDINKTKVFKEKKILEKEFNQNLKLKILKNFDQKSNELTNNLGVIKFINNTSKFSKFKFSKLDNFDYFEPELIFGKDNFVFFDDKGNLIKFDSNFKIIWKKNFYSKQEKKMKPVLTLSKQGKYLVIIDNIAKIYVVDFNSGNLIWSKRNQNPFNSQIKIFDNKIYVVDVNNILRCLSLLDGSEIWKFNSENTFLKSSKRNSLIINNNIVYFNNSIGDVIAINANDGSLFWQTPTQSSDIYENSFSLITSDLVAKNNNLIFSNNRNEFYSMSLMNGVMNWKQDINSSVRPVFFGDLIFTISDEGFFVVLDKNTGSIIRITNIFNNLNIKKRKKIAPVGFIAGAEKIILSTTNGRLLTIDIETGKTESILKIDSEKISRPFIFDEKIILVKNNAIIRLN